MSITDGDQIGATTLRLHLRQVLEAVAFGGVSVVVCNHGVPRARLVPLTAAEPEPVAEAQAGGGETPGPVAAPRPPVSPIAYGLPEQPLPRVKTSGQLTADLQARLASAYEQWCRGQWSSGNGPAPTLHAFTEGLLRLALKHVADPELEDLIPDDLRRTRHQIDLRDQTAPRD